MNDPKPYTKKEIASAYKSMAKIREGIGRAEEEKREIAKRREQADLEALSQQIQENARIRAAMGRAKFTRNLKKHAANMEARQAAAKKNANERRSNRLKSLRKEMAEHKRRTRKHGGGGLRTRRNTRK